MKILKHLKKILIHKFWVFYYCCKYGIIWQGIFHDLSKFSLIEFIESCKYYEGNRSPIAKCVEINGYSNAWLHHKGHNKHHYEYWLYVNDDKIYPVEMPKKYVKELCCDWLGAGRAYMGKDFTIEKEQSFVINKLNKCKELIHPNTIQYIKEFFKIES